jgi:hypothetical protein
MPFPAWASCRAGRVASGPRPIEFCVDFDDVTVMIADEMRAVAPLIKNVETIVSPLSQCLLPVA